MGRRRDCVLDPEPEDRYEDAGEGARVAIVESLILDRVGTSGSVWYFLKVLIGRGRKGLVGRNDTFENST